MPPTLSRPRPVSSRPAQTHPSTAETRPLPHPSWFGTRPAPEDTGSTEATGKTGKTIRPEDFWNRLGL